MPGNLSSAITDFAAGLAFEDLSPAAVDAARRATLDAIGVMAAASGTSAEAAPFVQQSIALATGGRCTILGRRERVSAPMAALANGAMSHALDYEDVFDAAPCHPNASAIPAGLAMAQHVGGVSGRSFLAAVVAGCEIACRIALSVRDSLEASAWYPPPVLGAHGAAVVAARLLGGDSRMMRDTLSLTMMQHNAPAEIRHDADTTLRATREAFPAHAAVSSAMLAAAGVRGFEDPLDGRGGFFQQFSEGRRDETELVRDAESRLHIEALSFKRWPTCRGTHAAIEMARTLVAEDGLDWRQVASVDVVVSPLQRMLAEPASRKRAPSTLIDAKFSLPFTIAVAFVKGEVTLGALQPPILRDEDVLAVARRVSVQFREDREAAAGTTEKMRVRLRSGRCIELACPESAEGIAAPLPDSVLLQKFLDCIGRSAAPPPADLAREVAHRILSLDDEPDVGRLIDRLFPGD